MSVTYLTTPIVEVRNDPPPRGSGMTREGYTKRSGAPTSRMIRLQGEKRWRRLMAWQFSNLGTLFVKINGKPHVVREEMLPREGAVSSHAMRKKSSAHTTKKSAAQLNREIAEALAPRHHHSTVQGSEPIYTLSADQLAALRTFAQANGRSWKFKLNHAWSTGRYQDYNGTDDYGSLQQVRNRFGPSWLVRFAFDRVKTHSVKG